MFDYIQQRFGEPIALETLASLATFGASYFSRLFKACTGIGVTEYIQQVRVHRACELLRETSRSVPEISEEIGYGDANYFGKVFKRQIGITPPPIERSIGNRRLFCFPVGAAAAEPPGGNAHDLPENFAEIALIRKSHRHGDVRQGIICRQQ